MLEARTLTVGFSDSEDRLWLRLGTDRDGAVQLWLTRRVLSQLLPQVWDLLARSLLLPPDFSGPGQAETSATLPQGGEAETIDAVGKRGQTQNDQENLRRRQLLIEHELALESSPPLDDEAARERYPQAMDASPKPEGLLSRVHVSADDRTVRFQFDGPHRSLQFAGSRTDAHRVLRMIWNVQAQAAWGLAEPWVEGDGAAG